jgi:hypothetical protein
MSNPMISACVRLQNGKLISKSNMTRLVVRGNQDISQNIRGYGFTPAYREMHAIMREPRGYIWREVTHAMGINGHHRTLRGLVMATCCDGYEIEVLPEPVPEEIRNAIAQHVQAAEKRRVA